MTKKDSRDEDEDGDNGEDEDEDEDEDGVSSGDSFMLSVPIAQRSLSTSTSSVCQLIPDSTTCL